MLQTILSHKAEILGVLLAISEGLALTSLKSNSILQFIINGLKSLSGKSDAPKA